MTGILSFGEVLVEIMRPDLDQPLNQTATFVGPFASGAPAIFADAVAKLGGKSRLLASYANDPFGELCVQKLLVDGVDTQFMPVSHSKSTGIAFVSYKSDGSRDFLFHLADSAAAELSHKHISSELFIDMAWLHINGSSLLISPSMKETGIELIKQAKTYGLKLSFDPNIRPELIKDDPTWLEFVLSETDLILPSGEEACFLTGLDDASQACNTLLEWGISTVIHKRGAKGSTLYSNSDTQHIPSLQVTQVDPTGAGDAFSAAFLSRMIETNKPVEAAAFANVVGALAVTALGPMEALPTYVEAEHHYEIWRKQNVGLSI